MPFIPDAPSRFAPGAPTGRFVPDAPADPREAGVPGSAAFQVAQAARPAYVEPSLGEKVRGGIEAARNVLGELASSVPAMAGGVAGFIGALGNNAAVKMGGAGQMISPPDAASQTAHNVHDFLTHDLLTGQDTTSPTGQEYTQNAMEALQPVLTTVGAHFPAGVPGLPQADEVVPGVNTIITQPVESMGRAAGSLVGAPDMGGAAAVAGINAVGQGARAVGAAASPVRMLAPKPDKEMLKTATIAQDKFPDIPVLPHDLAVNPTGQPSLSQSLSRLPGAGGGDLNLARRAAVSNYAIKLVNPADEDGRLTPRALRDALDEAYKPVRAGYDAAPPQDGKALEKVVTPVVQDAHQVGSTDAGRQVQGFAEQLLSKTDENGQIDPAAVQSWDQRVGKAARDTTDPGVARHLSNLQDAVRERVEEQLPPDLAMGMQIGRQRYATGIELYPIARAPGTVNSGIINDPGQILRAVTDDRNGKVRVARGVSSDLIDLAKVGDMVKNPPGAGAPSLHVPFASAAETVLKGVAGVVAGRSINKSGPALTREMVEANRSAPEAPPTPAPVPEPAPPLALGYDPAVSASGGRVDLNPVAVTPEGQAVPPGLEQAREDLAVSQRNAGGTGAPPPATTYADYDLNAPEFQPRQVTVPEAATPPSELPPEWDRLTKPPERRVPSGAKSAPHIFPEETQEPSLPPVAVVGRPGEVAATPAANEVMMSPGAAAARAAQNAPPPPANPPTAPKSKKGDQMVESKPAAEEKPPIEFDLSDPQWRAEHGGMGAMDTELVKTVAQANALDSAATAAAAARYVHDPRGFEKAVREIVKGAGNASEHQPVVSGGDGTETPEAGAGPGEPAGGKPTAGAKTSGGQR